MRRRVLILVAAFLLAGISGAAVLSYARSADRRALAGNEGVWVLVAKSRIPADTMGADLRSRGLTTRILVPAKTVPQGTLTAWDPGLDKLRLAAPLEAGQLLMRPLFHPAVKPSPSPSRRLQVPADQLAVTVALAVAPQVAGDLERGDKVVVYASCLLEIPGGAGRQDWRTRVLLPDVRVIAIGEAPGLAAAPAATPSAAASVTAAPSPSATAGTDQSLERYVATLSVDAPDAPRLIHAARVCQLYLALVGPEATATVGDWVDSQELFE